MKAQAGYWYDKNWLRGGVLAALALAALQLVSGYIQKVQQTLPDTPTYYVISSGFIEPGKQASVRISARMLDSKDLLSVQVEDATLDGHPIHFTTSSGGPAMMQMDVPHVLSNEPALALLLRTGNGPPRKVTLPLSLARPAANFSAVAQEDSLSSISDDFRVNILPDELVMGMTNSLYVFVRHEDGRPAAGANIDVACIGAKASGKTTPWGVFEFKIVNPRTAFECKVRINKDAYESSESLRAYGKGIQLTPATLHTPIGHPQTIHVQTFRENVRLYCDLRQGSVWRHSWTVDTRHHETKMTLPALDAGLYQVQCALHDLKAGEAVATAPIVVSDDSAHDAILPLLLENQVWFKTSLPEQVNGHPSDVVTQRFWLESLREAPFGGEAPKAFTAAEDKELRREHRKTELASFGPFVLLILLLVIIWITELHLRRRAEATAQFEALSKEDSLFELGITADASQLATVPYLRSRAILFGVVTLGVVSLNVLLFNHLNTILG